MGDIETFNFYKGINQYKPRVTLDENELYSCDQFDLDTIGLLEARTPKTNPFGLIEGPKKANSVYSDEEALNDTTWKAGDILHTIRDLTTDDYNLYACGMLYTDATHYKAAFSRINMKGRLSGTVTYQPVVSDGYWNAICVDGNYIYVGGSIRYTGENVNRAVIHAYKKSDSSFVWEYKYPLQTTAGIMYDIDIDANGIYGLAYYDSGFGMGRCRVALGTGAETWQATIEDTNHDYTPTTAGVGIICDSNMVYITKGNNLTKKIDNIYMSNGTVLTESTLLSNGQLMRGCVVPGTDDYFYICGYYYTGNWNPSIMKVCPGTSTIDWEYSYTNQTGMFYNCIADIDRVYAIGMFSQPILIAIDGLTLKWTQTIANTYTSVNGITQSGGYLYNGINLNSNNTGLIQRRSKTTGELVN